MLICHFLTNDRQTTKRICYNKAPAIVGLRKKAHLPMARYLRKEYRNSILKIFHYSDQRSANSNKLKTCLIQSKALYPDVGIDTSSLWNFCTCSLMSFQYYILLKALIRHSFRSGSLCDFNLPSI